MRSSSRQLLFLPAMVLLLQAPAPQAQKSGPPQVRINVHDTAGTPIAGATVALEPAPLTLHTASDGWAELVRTAEPTGLRVSAPGYVSKTLHTGFFSTIDVALVKAGSGSPADALQAGGGALTIHAAQERTFTPSEFATLPHQTITVVNGHTHTSEIYSGVALIDLLSPLGAPAGDVKGKALSNYLVATGSDGYKAVLSLAEVEPAFHPGTVLVADQLDGKPLDGREGPFKLVVSEDERPARSVHNLVRLELKQAE